MIARIPSFFRRKPTEVLTKLLSEIGEAVFQEGEVLWVSKPLTERDLNIPTGSNTNPTGSMLFKKGEMEDIDQRHYFREEVFKLLDWRKDSKTNLQHYERAESNFRLIILGEDKGVHLLNISHNTNTSSKSYLQNNSMTSISWGVVKPLIANRSLLGKTMVLYQGDSIMEGFIIRIN